MDPDVVQEKLEVFAQHLLIEAQGDPIRALGLLTLALDGPECPLPAHAWRLMLEVRRILVPESIGETITPIQHLVGTATWEGMQHCLRCGKVLAGPYHSGGESLLPGYAFEVGSRVTSEVCDEYRECM